MFFFFTAAAAAAGTWLAGTGRQITVLPSSIHCGRWAVLPVIPTEREREREQLSATGNGCVTRSVTDLERPSLAALFSFFPPFYFSFFCRVYPALFKLLGRKRLHQ